MPLIHKRRPFLPQLPPNIPVELRRFLVAVAQKLEELVVDPDPPAQVTNVTATKNNLGILLEWDEALKAHRYRVYRNVTTTFAATTTSSGASIIGELAGRRNTSFIDTADQLNTNQTRYYWISAVSESNQEGPISGMISSTNFASSSAGAAAGVDAVASGSQSAAYGQSATASGLNSVSVGYLSIASGSYTVAIGQAAEATAESGTAVGMGAQADALDSISIGRVANIQHATSIGLGRAATSTATNQFVVGGSGAAISTIYVGNGVTNASPQALTFNVTGGTGTNIAGANFTLAGGISTGNASGGSLLFQTSSSGASGTGSNSLTTRLTINATGNCLVAMGTSTGTAPIGGVANINVTAVGNVGVGEDDLISYTLPANALSSDGKAVRVRAWGTAANNANAKTVKLYFGATAILTTSLTVSVADSWWVEGLVIRTGSSTQDTVARLEETGSNTMDMEVSTAAITDTATIVIKLTGEATSNNDIVNEGLLVEMLN